MLKNGLKSRRPKKTPLLLKQHRDARFKFVRQHQKKENSFREIVLWTGTKIELSGHNYRNHMCRSLLTKEHCTNCQIWRWQYKDLEMFSAKGIGDYQ